jgi:hypothetical protein
MHSPAYAGGFLQSRFFVTRHMTLNIHRNRQRSYMARHHLNIYRQS